MGRKTNIYFDVLAPFAIDSRLFKKSKSDLDLILYKYEHMLVHVIEEDLDYRFYPNSTPQWVAEPRFKGVEWGSIGGNLNDQTDLKLVLDGKSDVGHTHPPSTPSAHTHQTADIQRTDGQVLWTDENVAPNFVITGSDPSSGPGPGFPSMTFWRLRDSSNLLDITEGLDVTFLGAQLDPTGRTMTILPDDTVPDHVRGITPQNLLDWDAAYQHSLTEHLQLGTSEVTAFRGDLGLIAYTHSQAAHAPIDAEKNVNADWFSMSGDSQILNKPSLFPPEAHNHPISDIIGLQTELDTLGTDISNNTLAIQAHESRTDNPHAVTKAQVGLGSVENLSPADLPLSDASISALDLKVDKEAGKGLSTNDFTDAYQTKLDGVEDGAQVNVKSDWLSVSGDSEILNKPAAFPPQNHTHEISDVTGLQGELDNKVDKITGKGLSEEDYTTVEKDKLSNIEAGAEVNVQSDWNATVGDALILNKPTTLDDFSNAIPDPFVKVSGMLGSVIPFDNTGSQMTSTLVDNAIKEAFSRASIEQTTSLVVNLSDVPGLTATNALNDLKSRIDNMAAVEVSYDNSATTLDAVEVQAAINELSTRTAGGLENGIYKFSSEGGAPELGRITLDTDDLSATGVIYVNNISDTGTDIRFYMEGMNVGDRILIQAQNDSNNFIRGILTGEPVDNGPYWSLPIENDDNGGSFTNNERLGVAIRYFNLQGGDADTLGGKGPEEYVQVNLNGQEITSTKIFNESILFKGSTDTKEAIELLPTNAGDVNVGFTPVMSFRQHSGSSKMYLLAKGNTTYFGQYNSGLPGGVPQDKGYMIGFSSPPSTAPTLSVGDSSTQSSKVVIGGYTSYHEGNLTKDIIDALGINATTLDALDSSQFLRSDQSDILDGKLTINAPASIGLTVVSQNTNARIEFENSSTTGLQAIGSNGNTLNFLNNGSIAYEITSTLNHNFKSGNITTLGSINGATLTGDGIGITNLNASQILTGTIPSSVLPPLAITSVQVANSEAEMLALTTEEGDVVVRTDESKTYIRNSGTTGTMSDFTQLQTPVDLVLSVNGKTGTVVLATGDIAESTNLYYTEARVAANPAVAANTDKVSFPGFGTLEDDYGFSTANIARTNLVNEFTTTQYIRNNEAKLYLATVSNTQYDFHLKTALSADNAFSIRKSLDDSIILNSDWSTTKIHIGNSSSKVSIGRDSSTAPTERLDVAGNIRAAGSNPKVIIADKSAGEDWVDGQELGSLSFFTHFALNEKTGIYAYALEHGTGSDYKPGLKFKTSSQTMMTIKPGGYIGMGTEDPVSPLHIKSNSAIAVLRAESSGAVLMDFESGEASAYRGIRFYEGGSQRMSISHIAVENQRGYTQIGNSWDAGSEILVVNGETSRVGLNTTTPEHTLDVLGEARIVSSGLAKLIIQGDKDNTFPDDNSVAAILQFGLDGSKESGSIALQNGSGVATMRFKINTGEFFFNQSGTLSASAPPTSAPHLTNKAYVDTEISNIGIGGYVPYTGATSNLDLGDKYLKTTSDITGHHIEASGSYPNMYVRHAGTVLGGLRADALTKLELRTLSTAPLSFQVNSSEKMIITNSGNIGIGTNNPSEKLDVVGNATIGTGSTTYLDLRGDDGSSDYYMRFESRWNTANTFNIYSGSNSIFKFSRTGWLITLGATNTVNLDVNGYIKGDKINPTNLTATRLPYYNGSELVDSPVYWDGTAYKLYLGTRAVITSGAGNTQLNVEATSNAQASISIGNQSTGGGAALNLSRAGYVGFYLGLGALSSTFTMASTVIGSGRDFLTKTQSGTLSIFSQFADAVPLTVKGGYATQTKDLQQWTNIDDEVLMKISNTGLLTVTKKLTLNSPDYADHLSLSRAGSGTVDFILTGNRLDLSLSAGTTMLKVLGDLQATGSATATNFNTGNLNIRNSGTSSVIDLVSAGNMYFNTGGATVFQLSQAGNARFLKGATIVDNETLGIGDSNDLRLYHNGLDSYIDNYSGSVYHRQRAHGGSIYFSLEDTNGVAKSMLNIYGGAEPYIRLFHNGDERLATTSSGVYITGILFATGDLYSESGVYSNILETSSKQLINSTSDQVYVGNPTATTTLESLSEIRVSRGGSLYHVIDTGNIKTRLDAENVAYTDVANTFTQNQTISSTGDAVLRLSADSDNDSGEIGDAIIHMTADGGDHGWSIISENIGGGAGTLTFNHTQAEVGVPKLTIDRLGNVSADYFVGDGSLLTGLTAIKVAFDNTGTFLEATNTQDAIADLDTRNAGGLEGSQYVYDSDTSAGDPGSGRVRSNSSSAETATEIYISTISGLGTDIRFFMLSTQAGDRLLTQQQDDAAAFASFEFTGPAIDEGTYWRIPVVNLESGTGVLQGKKVYLALRYFHLDGGNADTLNGLSSSAFMRTDTDTGSSGSISANGGFIGDGSLLTNLLYENISNPPTIPSGNFAYTDVANEFTSNQKFRATGVVMDLAPTTDSTGINPVVLYRSKVNGTANYLLVRGGATYFGTYAGGVPTDTRGMIELSPRTGSEDPLIRVGTVNSADATVEVGANVVIASSGSTFKSRVSVEMEPTNDTDAVNKVYLDTTVGDINAVLDLINGEII